MKNCAAFLVLSRKTQTTRQPASVESRKQISRKENLLCAKIVGVGAVLVVIEYINSTLSIFLTKEVAEKEFPGPDGLHLHLASDLPTKSYKSFMMFRSSENGGHLYPIFIIFLEGNDFLSQINARKLVNWNNCIFFIEFFGVEA